MPNSVIYYPLLKKGFQEVNDASAEIDDLKQHKITKCKTVADLINLDDGEIFQWQGPDNVENNLKNGFFYNTSGQVTIPIGTPFIEIPDDIVGEFSTIKAGKYYNTGHQSVTMLGYRGCTDTNNNNYRYFHFGAQADMPRVGDSFIIPALTYSETTTYYTIASVSWVTGNTYDITLNNGDALTVTVKTAGGSFAILQEFENNDGKIYLYNYDPYTSFNPVLFADVDNNNAVIYAPFITDGTTDEEIIITGGYAQTDTQPRLTGISNDEGGGVAISTDVTIAGNLTVQGTQTVVQTQEIDSESDNINLRYNNPLALADGEESGVKVLNYDGNNTNCFLGVDNQGWARVGDEGGTLQKLATIQDTPTDGAFVKYNTTTKQLESGTIPTPAEATTTTAGLMSAADKDKLNGIAQGAQVNPTATAVSSYSGANGVSIKAVKYGRIVSLFVTSATTSNVTITLANQFKPLYQFYAGYYSNSNNSISVNVNTDGVAKVSGIWNTSQGNFLCTYFSAS